MVSARITPGTPAPQVFGLPMARRASPASSTGAFFAMLPPVRLLVTTVHRPDGGRACRDSGWSSLSRPRLVERARPGLLVEKCAAEQGSLRLAQLVLGHRHVHVEGVIGHLV